LEKFRLLKIE